MGSRATVEDRLAVRTSLGNVATPLYSMQTVAPFATELDPIIVTVFRSIVCCFKTLSTSEQSGAVEACWAHNPEVRGSKPRSATFSLSPNENALICADVFHSSL